MTLPAYHGLIQHSFALENHESHRPFDGKGVKEMVGERFAPPGTGGAEFQLGEIAEQKRELGRSGSPLFNNELTTLDPHERTKFLKWRGEYTDELPTAFSWAGEPNKEQLQELEKGHWERIIFAETEESERLSLNDFLVKACGSSECEPLSVSEMLCELLAARRSMLFGLALANRFVNVMLPHALLTPAQGQRGASARTYGGAARWLLQPLVSLIRVGNDGGDFRRMYSLTHFLIPVEDSCCEAREVPETELTVMVNAGWGLATSPSNLPKFTVSGPLPDYISRLAPSIMQYRDLSLQPCDTSTLREATEAITFAVALGMAQGPTHYASSRVRREIGDEVVSSLGNSRVSSVMVVDKKFEKDHLDDSQPSKAFPGALESLMRTLAGEVRTPPTGSNTQRRKYRLDRPYIDHKDYAIGVLPSNRCLVVTSDHEAQFGRWDSGLMQAGWIAYTVIGAASAIGTMRAINRALETVDRTDPRKIAEIEHEVAVDLHELYDLDITWEAYRLRYRRLREQLGVTSDYQALHGKLEALYRETSACFEAKTQRRLFRLTAAIVALTALTILVSVVVK